VGCLVIGTLLEDFFLILSSCLTNFQFTNGMVEKSGREKEQNSLEHLKKHALIVSFVLFVSFFSTIEIRKRTCACVSSLFD